MQLEFEIECRDDHAWEGNMIADGIVKSRGPFATLSELIEALGSAAEVAGYPLPVIHEAFSRLRNIRK